MSRPAIFFLLVVAPAFAILLALLGIETLSSNPVGWFLFLVGVVYAAGLIIVYHIKKERFWESSSSGAMEQEERGDWSFWLVSLGMIAVFYLAPLEWLYFNAILPRASWMSFIGLMLVILGAVLFVWARRRLRSNYSGHISVKDDQELVQSGPYRIIRHPAYLGYLLMALGVSLGYSSIMGLSAILLLVPALVYRIHVEEKLLEAHFGAQFRTYAEKSARLIPGLW
ncbi:MAG: isoprenylcysteine carboxylmethyltransferase family protein [Chloroflexi bacterium]|nr:isoprenylcysteine carboxylmethyltransferase family protein [Chloroflexota bacterium]